MPGENLETIHRRLDRLLAERDARFPRRDAANSAGLRATLDQYMGLLLERATHEPPEPDAARAAQARTFAEHAVVVCGFMKSGTTLLLQLLDGHPDLFCLPGDTHLGAVLRGAGDVPAPDDAASWSAYWLGRMVNPTGQAPFWFLGEDDANYSRFLHHLTYWRNILGAGPRGAFLAVVFAAFCNAPHAPALPKAWVEKTPGEEGAIETIRGAFPAARFIHVVRDPLDNLASLKRLYAFRNWDWNAQSVAWGLRRSLQAGLEHLARLGPERYHLVKYEDLLDAPEVQMGRIARFLSIEMSETLLRPSVGGQPARSNTMFEERRAVGRIVARPARSPGTGLDRRDRREALAVVGPLASRLGYRCRRLESLCARLAGLVRRAPRGSES